LLLSAKAQYVGTPPPSTRLRSVLKGSLELKCSFAGGDGQFLDWYKDGVSVLTDKPGHYDVNTQERETVLLIKIVVKSDAEVKNWYVKTRKSTNDAEPVACRFGQIQLIPSPQGIATNDAKEKSDGAHGSIRRVEDESVRFKCMIDPPIPPASMPARPHDRVEWDFSPDGQTYGRLPDDVRITDDTVSIDRVKKEHRGHYRCQLNNIYFSIFLRVKDRWAAFWPFIGIVGIVVLLVIVILIFEKRQKSAKKQLVTEDDEHDHADDPLVRPGNKTSDSESKKRAVKA